MVSIQPIPCSCLIYQFLYSFKVRVWFIHIEVIPVWCISIHVVSSGTELLLL